MHKKAGKLVNDNCLGRAHERQDLPRLARFLAAETFAPLPRDVTASDTSLNAGLRRRCRGG